MNWPTDSRDCKRLGLAVLGAAALHAALLAAVGTVGDERPPIVPPPPALAARFAFAMAHQAAVATPPAAPPGQETGAPLPAAPQAASPVPASGRPGAASAAGGDEFAGYLRRREVDEPAQPAGTVEVPFPPDIKGTVDLRAEVTLFVDEHGTVRHVRIDSPDVHPAFAQAIRDSFGAAPFVPGKVQGEPVRSRVRLEVQFSNLRR